jgi:hypothetical protein
LDHRGLIATARSSFPFAACAACLGRARVRRRGAGQFVGRLAVHLGGDRS